MCKGDLNRLLSHTLDERTHPLIGVLRSFLKFQAGLQHLSPAGFGRSKPGKRMSTLDVSKQRTRNVPLASQDVRGGGRFVEVIKNTLETLFNL